jgi:hypothetical protein
VRPAADLVCVCSIKHSRWVDVGCAAVLLVSCLCWITQEAQSWVVVVSFVGLFRVHVA